ncbi:MAG: response regulator [Tenuifilaceae bacterium]|jgi:CheY-like chemotaxis protein|nr:response regulator [Tenuifilaceae bacterium]
MIAKSILLVEDVYYNQVLVESLLVDWGYAVEIVKNGAEALDRMKEKSYDLIVLDIMMPIMDGFTFLDEKKKVADKTPVIILTARNEMKSIQKALELGANDYVAKPFNSFDLRNKVALLLAKK